MDNTQFFPTPMQDGGAVIAHMHVNGLIPSNHQSQQGSAAILLLLFLIFFVVGRNKSSRK
jgi:hypothetical protein